MQPLQYVSQHPVANMNLSTRMATPDDNNHAAIPMRPSTTDFQETHRTTHADTTARCRTQRRNPSRPERPQPHLPHTQVPFIAGCNHFTRKNARFRAPASSPKQSPGKIHAAITIRFAASPSKPASLSTRMATPDDNNHAAIPMRSSTTDFQETHRTTHADTTTRCRTQRRNPSRPERPQPHPPHTQVPFIAGCNHFTRKNARFRAPASSPKQSPGKIHAAITTSLSVLLCDVKSHTTVSHHPSLSVFLCDVKSHTTLY